MTEPPSSSSPDRSEIHELRAQITQLQQAIAERDRRIDQLERDLAAARRAATESQVVLDTLLDRAPIGFAMYDHELRCVRANAALVQMIGLRVEELLGRTLSEVFSEPARAIEDHMRSVLVTGNPIVNVELSGMVPGSPNLRHWLVSYYPVSDVDGSILGVGAIMMDDTTRVEMEAALRESEARFRGLVEHLPIVVYKAEIADLNRTSYINPQIEALLGYTAEEWLADPTFWLSRVHPDDIERLLREQELVYDGAPLPSDHRMIARDGRVVWVHDESVIIRDEQGQPLYLLGFTQDITARKRAEDAQRFLAEASGILASSLDYDATLARIAQLAVPRLADGCAVYLDQGDGTMRIVAVAHVDPEQEALVRELDRRYPIGRRSLAQIAAVLRNGKSLLAPAAALSTILGEPQDEQHRELIQRLRVSSMMCAPLMVGGRALGALAFALAGTHHTYGPEDLALAEELARRAAVAIDNARLYRDTQAALRQRDESLLLLDALLAHAPIGMGFLDRSARYRRVNPALAAMNGLAIADHLGRTVHEVTPALAQIVEPLLGPEPASGRAVVSREISSGAAGSSGEPGTWLVTSFAVQLPSGEPWGVGIAATDITQRKELERELREAQLQSELERRRLRTVLDLLPVGVVIADVNGKLVQVNAAMRELWGGEPSFEMDEESAGLRGWWAASGEPLATQQWALMRALEHGETSLNEEIVIQTRDGRRRRILSSAVPMRDEAGQIASAVMVNIDITERTALEQKLQQAQRLESLGVLAGGIAHDFNNLLAVIIGNAELVLADLSADDPARESLIPLLTAARRAAELTRQMLAYSGRGRYVIERLNLNALIGELATLLRSSVSRAVTMRTELDLELPPVEADATQLRQVVMNLVINAGEAIGEGPGTIVISTSSRWMTAEALADYRFGSERPPGHYAVLTVTDTGCGMDAQTSERIFDPFYTTKFTGRGLGLAAVLGIVRAHRGALRVDSAVGRGTTFTILLPASDDAPGPDHGARKEPLAVPARRRGTVLVVDDEHDVCVLAQRQLERLGYTVLVAPDGAAAVQLFRAHAGELRAVLLDLTMPGLSGASALQQMRAIAPHVPVVVMSGHSADDVVRQIPGLGAEHVLQKPFSSQDLDRVLRAVTAE